MASLHVLMEDVSSDRWRHPSNRMKNFLMEDPESYFACTVETESPLNRRWNY